MAALPRLATIQGSRWLAWLREESGGVLVGAPLVHYAIATVDDCIDVASQFPPIVDWMHEWRGMGHRPREVAPARVSADLAPGG
jgi:hypothetical protein